MPTTTNYGWTTPADTDLVKDGAAAIRTLGSSIDSTLKTQIDAQIPDSLLTTKGDLIAATGASTPARLGVGANDTVLMADSTASTGIKWGTVTAGGMTQIASGNLSGSSVNITSISQSYKNLVLVIKSAQPSGGAATQMRLNNVSTALYQMCYLRTDNSATVISTAQTAWTIQDTTGTSANSSTSVTTINNYTNAGHPTTTATWDGNTNGHATWSIWGASQAGLDGAVTQINLFLASGTWSAGNYTLFGVN